MDKLDTYRRLVKDLLTADAQYAPTSGDVETLLVFDEETDSYQLMYVGWEGRRRVHGPIIHIRLRNDKIWIEYDGTEEGIATKLVEAGVPKADIVLAFHSPWKRQFTEYAVA
jgi:hypothetical protein